MTGEVLDASRQQGHLHLRRAGVVRHAAVVSNDLAGLFCGKGHGYLFLQNADAELVQPHRPMGLHKLRWLDVKLWNKLAIVARAGGWQQERGARPRSRPFTCSPKASWVHLRNKAD